MENNEMIPIEDCCSSYNIEQSFVVSLNDYGLIHVTAREERYFIPAEELADLEKYIRWHYDMDINLEGIEVINHLLERIRQLQHELTRLQNRSHT